MWIEKNAVHNTGCE